MLDLSNNNGTRHNFHRAYVNGGQRRIYLKRTGDEGRSHRFVDTSYPILRDLALGAGLHVGAYDFTEPVAVTPHESVELLLSHLTLPLRHEHDLRPALDIETGTPSPRIGEWVRQAAKLLQDATGHAPLIYGSGWYLQELALHEPPGPLWLAAYGRNDGREYPIGLLPKPWKRVAAHQYTSLATVAGIEGRCDLSHVFVPSLIDVPRHPRLAHARVALGGAGRIYED